jgi:hypothetical protein
VNLSEVFIALLPNYTHYNIVACRQKAGMIEDISVDFLGNDQRSHGSG